MLTEAACLLRSGLACASARGPREGTRVLHGHPGVDRVPGDRREGAEGEEREVPRADGGTSRREFLLCARGVSVAPPTLNSRIIKRKF